MNFQKLSHGMDKSQKVAKCSQEDFDPRHSDDVTLKKDSLRELLTAVEASFPKSGLPKFWLDPKDCQDSQQGKDSELKKLILFSKEKGSRLAGQICPETADQIDECMAEFSLPLELVQHAKCAMRGQASLPL